MVIALRAIVPMPIKVSEAVVVRPGFLNTLSPFVTVANQEAIFLVSYASLASLGVEWLWISRV